MALDRGVHLYGDPMEVKVTVRETVTVKPGDLMFLNNAANVVTKLSGASTTADNYAYPYAALGKRPITGQEAVHRFLGVAMDGNDGNTATIAVATAGVFRFPLKTAGAVTIGAVASAVSPCSGFSASSSTTASYQIQNAANSGGYIGYFVVSSTGTNNRNADVVLRTAFGPGGMISTV